MFFSSDVFLRASSGSFSYRGFNVSSRAHRTPRLAWKHCCHLMIMNAVRLLNVFRGSLSIRSAQARVTVWSCSAEATRSSHPFPASFICRLLSICGRKPSATNVLETIWSKSRECSENPRQTLEPGVRLCAPPVFYKHRIQAFLAGKYSLALAAFYVLI